MLDMILYERVLQTLDANPDVEIIKTTTKLMESTNHRWYDSVVHIRYEGNVIDLIAPLGQNPKLTTVPQMAEHKCTISRYLGKPGNTLEVVVVTKTPPP